VVLRTRALSVHTPGTRNYYEISQKVIHLFDLHNMEERHAYCRLDKRGDVEDAIQVIEAPCKGEDFGANVITFDRDLLDEYLVLTDSVVVRTFDFTRCRPGGFSSSNPAVGQRRATSHAQSPGVPLSKCLQFSRTPPGQAA
jgi:hypothetical protein